jgi:predicted cupin superfamily sugar epimerase
VSERSERTIGAVSEQGERDRLVEALALGPLPGEGGWYRRSYGDDRACSVILYLMTAGDGFSAMHLLDADEVFTYVAGAAAEMLQLHPDGSASTHLIGMDLDRGQRPQVVVPAGVWQGTVPLGDWTLLTTTVSPAYSDEIFHLGDRDELTARWPAAAGAIAARTR